MDVLGTARRYHCARCLQPVIICRHCDRGNIYCFNGCAVAANKERCQRNSKRYQCSAKGRRSNAARQRRNRLRKALEPLNGQMSKQQHDKPIPPGTEPSPTPFDPPIVTHRGSVDEPGSAPLTPKPQPLRVVYCNACQRVCSQAMRIDFLRTSHHRSGHRTHNGALP
jgi:hypothetical protein